MEYDDVDQNINIYADQFQETKAIELSIHIIVKMEMRNIFSP